MPESEPYPARNNPRPTRYKFMPNAAITNPISVIPNDKSKDFLRPMLSTKMEIEI